MSTMEPDEGTRPDDQQGDAPRWEEAETSGETDAPRWAGADRETSDTDDAGSDS
jgi:hypothetical protein